MMLTRYMFREVRRRPGRTILTLAGIVIGFVGARLVDGAATAEWMTEPFEGIGVLAMAFLSFAGAEHIGGNGFIAAFVSGLVFGNTIVLPQGYANGREVPGTNEICCTLISHFGDLNGPIALVDVDQAASTPTRSGRSRCRRSTGYRSTATSRRSSGRSTNGAGSGARLGRLKTICCGIRRESLLRRPTARSSG